MTLPSENEFFAQELTLEELAFRRSFVKEYLRDFDAYRACLRLGLLSQFANKWKDILMGEAAVQRMIATALETIGDEDERALDADKQLVLSKMRMVALSGENKDAVNAAKVIAQMRGFNAPIKVDQSVVNKGGVMVVPATASLDEWERAALESQQSLVARSDV
jgi:hypothetical protein